VSDESAEAMNVQSYPDPQTLHTRAAESAKETRQLLTAMSTASIGVFFLAMSGENRASAISTAQVWIVLAAIALMALTAFSGLVSAFADAQWSYCWAREIEALKSGKQLGVWHRRRKKWHRCKRWSERAALVLFALGVLAASAYLATLVLAPPA
jgi:hypothetical protein